jgi:hypothetical protein
MAQKKISQPSSKLPWRPSLPPSLCCPWRAAERPPCLLPSLAELLHKQRQQLPWMAPRFSRPQPWRPSSSLPRSGNTRSTGQGALLPHGNMQGTRLLLSFHGTQQPPYAAPLLHSHPSAPLLKSHWPTSTFLCHGRAQWRSALAVFLPAASPLGFLSAVGSVGTCSAL